MQRITCFRIMTNGWRVREIYVNLPVFRGDRGIRKIKFSQSFQNTKTIPVFFIIVGTELGRIH